MWLTEMDLQLTNVEHFSASDIEDKMRQLNVSPVRPPFTTSCPGLLTPPGGHASCLQGFQQEITLNTNKIDALIVFGENLIQKSAPLDAALIEDELEELHSYCQEVFGRVARFHQRLVNRRPVSPAHTGRSLINTCNLITKHKCLFIEFPVCFWDGRFWRRSRNCRIWKSRLV